jgi:hypothetical protein
MYMTELLMALRSDRERELEAAMQRHRWFRIDDSLPPFRTRETPRATVADSPAPVAQRPSTRQSAL